MVDKGAMKIENDMSTNELSSVISTMRKIHASQVNQSYDWRYSQLLKLRKLITENRNEIIHAVQRDLSKHELEFCIAELETIENELSMALSNLRNWMSPKQVPSPGQFIPAYSEIRSVPLCSPGVLVISPFNYPWNLALVPAIGAIAGGNPVLIKPSESTSNSSSLLKVLISKYFDDGAIQVVGGGVSVTTKLLSYGWGLVFFTGSERVGKIVAQAAAKTLTPVVLELGGKCPTYIDRDCPSDLKVVANRVVWGKTLNAGQTCIGVDYVLVHNDVKEKFCEEVKQALERMYTSNPKNSGLARIATVDQAKRLKSLIEEAENCVVWGGSEKCDINEKYVCPTVILNPPKECRLLKEEIFGPILPIISVDTDDEAITYINQMPGTPLAMYVFTTSSKQFEKFLCQVPSAAAIRNDVVMNFGSPHLPFGGLGSSGYGSYHGKTSFETFTHQRAVVFKPCHAAFEYGGLRYQPYSALQEKAFSVLGILPDVPVLHTRKMLSFATVLGVCVIGVNLFF